MSVEPEPLADDDDLFDALIQDADTVDLTPPAEEDCNK